MSPLYYQLRSDRLRIKMALYYRVFSRTYCPPVLVLYSHCLGSKLLLSWLNSIPGVFLVGEIIGCRQMQGLREIGIFKQVVFRYLRHSIKYYKQTISNAKGFFLHLKERRITSNEMKIEFPDARWIVLRRKDAEAQNVLCERSRRILGYRKQSHYLNKKKHVEASDLNSEKTAYFCQKIQNDYRYATNSGSIDAENSHWVNSEELDHNTQEFFDRRMFPILKIKTLQYIPL